MNIQLYANNMRVEPESDQISVMLENIDISDLVGQLEVDDVLNEIELSDIKEYVARVEADKESDQYDTATMHRV